MRSLSIKRTTALQLLLLASLSLSLPLAAQASSSKNTTPGKPLVSTGGASHVTATSATLQGSVDPRTFATTYYFQYGPTTAYGSQTTPASLPAGTAKIKVSQSVSGIPLGYHYRLVATNADGTADGHDHTLSSQQAKKKSAFVLPKTFQPTPLGGAFIFSGALTGTGNGSRAVVLQASPYPYRGGYVNLGSPILTDATGHFSFRVASLSVNTKFRVATVGTRPLYSAVVPEQVTVRVILKVRTSSHAPGLVRLYGTVAPAEIGAHVFVQLEKAPKSEEKIPKGEQLIKPEKLEKSGKSGGKKKEASEKLPTFSTKFTTVVKRGTRGLSRFSVVVKIQDPGHYRAFVVIRPGPVASGHSQVVSLRAAPSSKKKHRKKSKK